MYLSCLVHTNMFTYYKESHCYLMSYNLAAGNAGEWILEDQTEVNSLVIRQLLLATNGLLLSFHHSVSDSVVYAYQDAKWLKLNATLKKNSELSLPIFAIPYYVRL